ncbi:cytochrome P450 [Streptomyces sp. SL13]|uniref:Cytochrome P450 n=1 Tax=Streptantibioticus silvisoli TaxID=2705255 RepID=A0AA90HED3_9ACTN|nr:cytochrome P450 [Streptantibioticus silvisoli]MDI5961818.1 cytochrome P450 [Streptantibioticus silvisoli]MDI5973372.1 cytochrome P450 [Streptantibioticus silvisoli]
MTTASPAEPLVFPAARGGCPFSPPPAHQAALIEEPVSQVSLWDGTKCWMITKHADVRNVLRDDRFSAEAHRPGFPFITQGRRAVPKGQISFIRMDDPEHSRLRRMLTAEFMIKRTEALRPRIQEIVDDFLDRMLANGSSADLVAEYALPIPSLVICLLLGVDYADHEFFQEHSRVVLRNASTAEEIDHAREALVGYLTDLARRKRTEPDDGIISGLVERGELTDEQIAAMGLLLLIAGHETTANMTALSTLALLRDPEQLAKLRAEPALMKGAVEELLRFLSIVHTGVPRVAAEDVEIGGRLIRAGDGVLCMINSANRDADTFPGPDELDITRAESRRHLAFGFGVHQCLGQPLARVELQIALETLLRRVPTLRLDCDPQDIRYREDMAVYGVHELPVAW